MNNRPKDLDASDYEADALGMYEEEMQSLADSLDGMDPYTVISIIADREGTDASQVLDSKWVKDLIQFSQSNPERAFAAIRRMSELDEVISKF